MSKPEQIEYLVEQLVRKIQREIGELNLPEKEFRRDFDGVSELSWLVEKMIGERLAGQLRYNDVYAGLTEILDKEVNNEQDIDF